MHDVYLYALIIGCEIAFWVVLLLGLWARYLLRRETLSKYLLLCLPLIDLLLLAFTALDLKSGTQATVAHGLATAYVGFTVAFGKLMVTWADGKFAHRFVGGPPPPPKPKYGWPVVRRELKLWAHSIVAWAIALTLIIALIAFVGGDPAATVALKDWFDFAQCSTLVWFVVGPLWALLSWTPAPKETT